VAASSRSKATRRLRGSESGLSVLIGAPVEALIALYAIGSVAAYWSLGRIVSILA
jgi:hypothetical protein